MPYIDQHAKSQLVCSVPSREPESVGELTFVLYRTALQYINPVGATKPVRYQTLAEVLGALEATKLEFYRRVVAPYEDLKLNENGDVNP